MPGCPCMNGERVMGHRPGCGLFAKQVDAWRAQHLCESANRIDRHIERLKKQAKEYRDLATKINPTG